MAYQKLLGQGTRILRIIPSDVGNIPFPGDFYHEGTNTATAVNLPTTAYDGGASLSTVGLKDVAADFEALDVKQGDIVYNVGSTSTTAGAGRVVEVVSSTELRVLTSSIALVLSGWCIEYAATGVPYRLYRAPLNNKPCMVYTNVADKSACATYVSAGGDTLDNCATNVPPQLIDTPVWPTQVRRIKRDGCYIHGTYGTLWNLGVW